MLSGAVVLSAIAWCVAAGGYGMGQEPMGQIPMDDMGQEPMGQIPMDGMGQEPMGQAPMSSDVETFGGGRPGFAHTFELGQEPFGQVPMHEDNHDPHKSWGQQPMGQEPMGQEPMGQEPMGQEPMGQEPMGQEPMGQEPMGQEPMGLDTHHLHHEKYVIGFLGIYHDEEGFIQEGTSKGYHPKGNKWFQGVVRAKLGNLHYEVIINGNVLRRHVDQ